MTHELLRIGLIAFCALGLLPGSYAQTPEKCVSTKAELKDLFTDRPLSLKWEETTMDDAKPMLVSISEKNGALSVEFFKTEKGLWAMIDGVFCRSDKAIEIRFTAEQIHFGPSASKVMRYALSHGGTFTLTPIGQKQLRVHTIGWSGNFASVKN